MLNFFEKESEPIADTKLPNTPESELQELKITPFKQKNRKQRRFLLKKAGQLSHGRWGFINGN